MTKYAIWTHHQAIKKMHRLIHAVEREKARIPKHHIHKARIDAEFLSVIVNLKMVLKALEEGS